MPEIRIFAIITMLALSACRTPMTSSTRDSETISRSPQQAPFIGETLDPEHETLFQEVLQNSSTDSSVQPGADNESQGPLESLVEKQSQVFYLTSSQVEQYDRELDRLYKMKIADPKKTLDLTSLNQLKVRMALSWEFTERNFHKLKYVYGRMLQEANSKASPWKKSSFEALGKLDRLLKEKWQTSNQWAVRSIVEGLEPINKSFEFLKPGSQFPEFRKLFNTPPNPAIKKTSNFKNSSLDEEFKKFKLEREAEVLQILKDRSPQAVGASEIRPSAGTIGEISGREFPKGTWAITMDDGPHETLTYAMMDQLERAGLKGHFFWLSQNMQRLPQVVQEARRRGFKLALHSHSHLQLTKLNAAGLTQQIDQAADIFESLVGQRPTFFRCPYGACGKFVSSPIRQRIASLKMVTVFWNVDTLDWHSGSSAQEVFERARKGMELVGGGIVLFHDIQERSVGAIRLLGAYMKSRPEWKSYTLDELVSQTTGLPYESP